jgi:SPP1 family predicted phage head-tail adaptor
VNGRRDISDMTSRVTIKQWNVSQDAGGGSYYTEAASWTVWASVIAVLGGQGNTEAQQQWSYNTTFKIRFNESFKSNMTVDDKDNVRWLINSIDLDPNNTEWFMNLRCSKTDINIDVS